jgi:hypothetical protein
MNLFIFNFCPSRNKSIKTAEHCNIAFYLNLTWEFLGSGMLHLLSNNGLTLIFFALSKTGYDTYHKFYHAHLLSLQYEHKLTDTLRSHVWEQ